MHQYLSNSPRKITLQNNVRFNDVYHPPNLLIPRLTFSLTSATCSHIQNWTHSAALVLNLRALVSRFILSVIFFPLLFGARMTTLCCTSIVQCPPRYILERSRVLLESLFCCHVQPSCLERCACLPHLYTIQYRFCCHQTWPPITQDSIAVLIITPLDSSLLTL